MMVGMIYWALKQFKCNQMYGFPPFLFQKAVSSQLQGQREDSMLPWLPPSWVFPSVLLASLILLCIVLLLLKFGTYVGLSQHEDEAIQAFLSCPMDYSVVLKLSY